VIRSLKRRRPAKFAARLLSAAEELVAAQKYLEAIQLLTEGDRVQRDTRIERRLIELRFDAFERIEWPSSRSTSTEMADDLFPGELIPEITPDKLTIERLRSAIDNHGSLLVRGLLNRDNVDLLVSDIDNAFNAFDAKQQRKTLLNGADCYMPVEMDGISAKARARKRAAGNMWAVESPPAFFDLVAILHEVGIRRIAHEYLDESPMLLARKVTLRRTPYDAHGGWHQDGAFMGEDLGALNVWTALSHCGEDAPSLDVVGRRIDHVVTPTGGTTAYAVSQDVVAQIAADSIVRPVFEPGDALIFDHLCLHRTGRDPAMRNGRYAIEAWIMAPSTYSVMTSPVENGYQPFDQLPLVF
jgi:hypothetical protein